MKGGEAHNEDWAEECISSAFRIVLFTRGLMRSRIAPDPVIEKEIR